MVRHGGKTKWKDMKKMDIHKSKNEAAEGTNVADTLLLQLDLQNYEKNKLLFFKPPSPWYFATAALTNSYKDWQKLLLSIHLFHLFEPIFTETLLHASYSGKMLV